MSVALGSLVQYGDVQLSGCWRWEWDMEQVRFAVLGSSMISDNFIETVGSSPHARYVGSMCRSLDKAERVTHDRGGMCAFSRVEEVAACEDVDAAYIATPNAIHYGQALSLIRAGKHVLVEKPIASDARKVAQLFDAARDAGVVAMEAMRPVHDPGIAKVKELLPRIGAVRRASLRYGKYSSRYDELLAGSHTNIFDARLATGALMDLGIYCVETMVALFGAPHAIACSSVLVSNGREELTGGPIDGAGTIVASYGNHVVNLDYSKVTQDLLPCQIEGESGTIVFEGVDGPTSGRMRIRGRAVRNAAKSSVRSVGDVDEEITFDLCDNNMIFELEDYIACIAGERDFEEFARISLTSLQIMDEARRQSGIVFPMDEEV